MSNSIEVMFQGSNLDCFSKAGNVSLVNKLPALTQVSIPSYKLFM